MEKRNWEKRKTGENNRPETRLTICTLVLSVPLQGMVAFWDSHWFLLLIGWALRRSSHVGLRDIQKLRVKVMQEPLCPATLMLPEQLWWQLWRLCLGSIIKTSNRSLLCLEPAVLLVQAVTPTTKWEQHIQRHQLISRLVLHHAF